jgi:D-xylose transport system permease protein
MSAPTTAATDFSGDEQPTSLREAFDEYLGRLKGGDMGPLPAVLGLIVLAIVFTSLQPSTFPSAINFANLMTQAGSICVLAMGLIPVLLLGEIDLSAGVAGGAAAGVMATLIGTKGWGWPLAVLGALLTGFVIGTAIGLLVSRLGIPSFVVTLAFFLGIQGITLRLIGQGGTVPIHDKTILAIANSNLPVGLSWILTIVAVLGYGALTFQRLRKQISGGLAHPPASLVVARVVALAIIGVIVTYVLNINRARLPGTTLRGVPYVVPIVLLLLIIWTFVFGRTTYGRHVYAVGGNREAARRAGINVGLIRISVFSICTTMAAISGIVAASRLNSVTPDAGAGNTLLYAVGAAVIGGTSLFGGKGKIRDAIIGGLVIAVIDNGLALLGYSSAVNYVVTGTVLLLAASVDAISRRRRSASGL